MRASGAWRIGLVSLSIIGWNIACQPPPAPPAHAEAVLSSTAPAAAASAQPAAAPAAPPQSANEVASIAGVVAPTEALECVAGADPELDKESPWSKELGQRLDAALPGLRRCSLGFADASPAEVTLRLVYGQKGLPISQHVVHSTPNGCQVVECLKQELAQVRSPKLMIEQSSYDIALTIERGAAPRRGAEPPQVLPAESSQQAGCVDPAVVALSRTKIKDVVSTSFDGLKGCYNQALVRDHQAAGNVTFEFVIGQEGKVARAAVRDATLRDCEAISCMLAEFRSLAFPAPVGRSIRVLYPISYTIEQAPVALR